MRKLPSKEKPLPSKSSHCKKSAQDKSQCLENCPLWQKSLKEKSAPMTKPLPSKRRLPVQKTLLRQRIHWDKSPIWENRPRIEALTLEKVLLNLGTFFNVGFHPCFLCGPLLVKAFLRAMFPLPTFSSVGFCLGWGFFNAFFSVQAFVAFFFDLGLFLGWVFTLGAIFWVRVFLPLIFFLKQDCLELQLLSRR